MSRTPHLADLSVSAGGQWITSTPGRIANGAYSWMQAVHWVHRFTNFTSTRGHGPRRFNRTTLLVAQELARLEPCRPGVSHLVRRVKASVRTVKYHLGLLRESGLLTYVAKGTRLQGGQNRASEFACTIPPAFDQSLGIRTCPSDRYIRAIAGVSEQGRPVLARLGTLAQRKVRCRSNSSSGTRRSLPRRCTPMLGGSSTSSSAGTTSLPSEAKLDNGRSTTTLPAKRSAVGRRLNTVGRRHQLARELIQQIPWLARAGAPRIAWIVRHVADAGWTAEEVVAVLAQRDPAHTVHRPSGFLADRLRGAHELYNTVARRQAIVDWWRDSRKATQARHAEWDNSWNAPRRASITRAVEAAFDQLCRPHRRQEAGGASAAPAAAGSLLIDLTRLTPAQVGELRAAALHDPSLITTTIDACGEPYARRLYTNELVIRVQRLATAGRLTLHSRRAV
ncbi:transcriptional regulator [Streptomyces sp. NPDC001581]|uniref:transcriptional regulator n=1 Tax=Streptomyces sp. NPDC001581 TaxID=3154386 RepID=UPI0033282DBC